MKNDFEIIGFGCYKDKKGTLRCKTNYLRSDQLRDVDGKVIKFPIIEESLIISIEDYTRVTRDFIERFKIDLNKYSYKWEWLKDYEIPAFYSIFGPYIYLEPNIKKKFFINLGLGGILSAYKRLGHSFTSLIQNHPINLETLKKYFDSSSLQKAIDNAKKDIKKFEHKKVKRARRRVISTPSDNYECNKEREYFKDMYKEIGNLIPLREIVENILEERKKERKLSWSFDLLKDIVHHQGIIRTGIPASLIHPETYEQWKVLSKSKRVSQEYCRIKCGRCKKVFDTRLNDLIRNRGAFCGTRNCKLIGNFLSRHSHGISYFKLKEIIKQKSLKHSGIEGDLLVPSNELEFLYMRLKSQLPPSKLRIKVRCNGCGSEWCPTIAAIQFHNHWCGKCTDERILSYDDLIQLVEESGLYNVGKKGILIKPNKEEFFKLSKSYHPSYVPIEVKCPKCNQIFPTIPYYLKNYKFPCPHCSASLYENICRWYMEKIFSYILKRDVLFPSKNISDIVNIDKVNYAPFSNLVGAKNMFLRSHFDGYSVVKELDSIIAFEYNGRQHYEFVKPMHKSKQDLLDQQERDRIKRKIAHSLGIKLIVIPYTIDPKMEDHIKIQKGIMTEIKRHFPTLNLKGIPWFNHHSKEFGKFFSERS